MRVHIICCNDSVEYAVIEDEARAKVKLEELRDAYFERNRGVFGIKDRLEYLGRCHWHIRTVDGEAP